MLLEFSVRDTGVGLTLKQIETIFEAFAQADCSTTRNFGGTGLGLSICRQLAALMGGEIGVTSKPGKGSTFTCTLPFLRGEVPAVESYQGPDLATVKKALTGCRILVAEDRKINQQVLRELLEQAGVSVTVVSDGLQAVSAVAGGESLFDAVLMDLQMPVLDGYGATLLLREEWPMDRLPIIAMTAHAMQEERERCLAGGMNDHLAKPVNPNLLYDCLMRWVRVGSGKSILIVDDEPASITRLNGMLPARHTCLAAIDGVTAIKLALRHQPNLILLDVAMPGMDGHEVCRTLKNNPATAQIPVILLTWATEAEELVKGFTAGAVDHIAKPFNVMDVNARVNTHLP